MFWKHYWPAWIKASIVSVILWQALGAWLQYRTGHSYRPFSNIGSPVGALYDLINFVIHGVVIGAVFAIPMALRRRDRERDDAVSQSGTAG